MKALMSENETFVADLNILISVLFIISKHGKIRCSTCFTNKEIIMLRSKSWCVVLPVNWWLGLCIFFTSINCWLWSLRSCFYIVVLAETKFTRIQTITIPVVESDQGHSLGTCSKWDVPQCLKLESASCLWTGTRTGGLFNMDN